MHIQARHGMMRRDDAMNILFVCTGNTCRSPMAEAIFREKTKKFSNYVKVSSCGLGTYVGSPASENAVLTMAERQIDISAHRSKQINQYIIDEADYIICLGQSHYKYLEPFAKDKLLILGSGISDPFMGDMSVYRECADNISKAIDELLQSDIFVSINNMIIEDVEAVEKIEKANFSMPWSEESFRSQIKKEYSVSFTAHYLGKPIGYVCCDDISGEVYIGTIAVDTEFRKQGIGTKLLNRVISYCEKNNSSMLTLEVRVSNESAVKLYEKLGFENLGVRKNFYSNPTEDAFIMTKYF